MVGNHGQGTDQLTRADRSGEDNPGRATSAGDQTRRVGGGTGSEAVIDDHRREALQTQPLMMTTVSNDAVVQLLPLLGFHPVSFGRSQEDAGHDLTVDNPDLVLAEGAEHQPGPVWHGEFADHHAR